MELFNYWRLCDDLSIMQAALLVVGENPSSNENVEQWEASKRPYGYDAAKTAIINGLRRNDIEGHTVFEYEYDMNGNAVGETEQVNIQDSIVSVSSLRTFLKNRGVTDGFFFPDGADDPNYLDPAGPYYAPKLAAAIRAWETISSDPAYTNGKTPKQAIEKWLREHANEYGLTNEEGNPVNAAIEHIAKVANWKPEGGASKTPTHAPANTNLTTPEKPQEDQAFDDLDEDAIPF